MSRKTFILYLVPAVLAFAALLLFFIFSGRDSTVNVEETEGELGSIEITDQPEAVEDDYEGDADYELEVKDYYVGFTNLETVYEILTLEAISSICPDAASFLNSHGYGDVHSLTVIESTIVYDKSYPFFVCSMEGVDDRYLEVRYDITGGAYEFALISEC